MVLIASVTLLCWADGPRWWSKESHRATRGAFGDGNIASAANTRFAADNELVGIDVTEIGPAEGGTEFEVRMIFDPAGIGSDLGDITAIVLVSTDLSSASVTSYEDPDPVSAPNPGGGKFTNSIENKAASAAFVDSNVESEVDSRVTAGVNFIDFDAIITGSDENGTTVDVIMKTDSLEPGKGDVTATVLVNGPITTVTQVTGE